MLSEFCQSIVDLDHEVRGAARSEGNFVIDQWDLPIVAIDEGQSGQWKRCFLCVVKQFHEIDDNRSYETKQVFEGFCETTKVIRQWKNWSKRFKSDETGRWRRRVHRESSGLVTGRNRKLLVVVTSKCRFALSVASTQVGDVLQQESNTTMVKNRQEARPLTTYEIHTITYDHNEQTKIRIHKIQTISIQALSKLRHQSAIFKPPPLQSNSPDRAIPE